MPAIKLAVLKKMNQSPNSNLPLCAQLVNDLISHAAFSSIVKTYNSDRNSKKFNSWDHLVWMTLSHIAGCRGIRDIAGLMSSLQGSINHLGGVQAPSKSTIAYQNQHRSWKVFQDAYYAIRKSLGQLLKQGYNIPEVHRRIKLLDSTTVTLSLNSFPWATYQHEKGGIKLHTVLDFEQSSPDFVHLTNGNVPDCIAAHEINLPKGCIVVADRGYMDFKLLQHWDSCGVKFVVRHTESVNFRTIEEWELPDEHQNILKDEVIAMQGAQSKVYRDILRRVVAHNDEGNYDVELLSNDFTLDCNQIAALYRDRWYIESFFKEIKQLLRIKSFMGTSANAVLIQVWTAMIAFLLVRCLQTLAKQKEIKWNTSNLVVFLRLNLLNKTNLWYWLYNPYKSVCAKPPDSHQGDLFAKTG